MLIRILSIIIPVLLIVLVGYLYARRHRPDLGAMNTLTVDLLSPLLIFSSLTSRNFDLWESRWLLLAGIAVMLGSGFIAWGVARVGRLDPRSFVSPMMFSNSGYMGLPLTLLAFGPERIPAGVALFVASTLLHMTLGIKLVNRQANMGYLLKSPLLIGSALGVAFNVGDVVIPDWVATAIKLLGDAAIPLMLFSLGARMADASLKGWGHGLTGAITCPLAGLLIAWFATWLVPMNAVETSQLYLFAALPPAVMNFLIAERYAQEPDKVAAMVVFGHIASLVFVPLGLWLALT